MSGSRLAAAVAAFSLLAGCGQQHFRAETVWHADGRVERAVYAPAEFFPENARTGWSVVRSTGEVASDAFTGSIRDLEQRHDSDRPYVAAWGTFLSPDAVPDHVRFVGIDPSQAGRLDRSTSINRLGLVTEYVWTERLTDVVSLADIESARREATLLVAELVEATLRNGELRYDISRLLAWLRSDAADWFDESHAVFVEAAIRRELRDNGGQRVADRLADIAAKHGLDLRSADGSIVTGSEFDTALSRFLVATMRDRVRTPEGNPVDEPTALELLGLFGITIDGEKLNYVPSDDWQRAVAGRFESEEQAKGAAAVLLTRLLGVYQAGIFTPPRPFRHEMTLPGAIVETTGVRVAENRVVWTFDAADAFPLGYEMSARSLVPNEAAQKAALGEVKLTSLEDLAEYASLVGTDGSLAAVMLRAVKTGSLKPLDEYEAALTQQSGVEPEVVNRVNAMRKLFAP